MQYRGFRVNIRRDENVDLYLGAVSLHGIDVFLSARDHASLVSAAEREIDGWLGGVPRRVSTGAAVRV